MLYAISASLAFGIGVVIVTQDKAQKKSPGNSNNVRSLREAQLISKAELARKAGVSALTIDRVESGIGCRMDTMRKIILALGFQLTEKDKVFPGS